MRLFEHPDFEQAIIRAAEHFRARGLRESLIEKDYFVTEALRAIADEYSDQVIFKGGTSLSKGWDLIARFSEDIDIFLDPLSFDPPLGTNAIDRELKKLRQAIERHPGLAFVGKESQTIGGFGRNDRFEYSQRFAGVGDVGNRVLVEAGTAGGRQPTAQIALHSYVGQFLSESSLSLGTDDEGPFTMRLLHFRRTFVEKLFAIHGKVEILKETGTSLGGYARHYYDLYCLADRTEVLTRLQSDEYRAIKEDYDRISRAYFHRSYRAPPALSFVNSDAFFLSRRLRDSLAAEFAEQCRVLCYGEFPNWEEVQARFAEIRDWL